MNPLVVAPSILAGDHARLLESALRIPAAGLRWLHLDIMDGHFVPNLTFGPQTLVGLKLGLPGLFYDVHLMLARPEAFIEPFAEAGADLITIHVEPATGTAATLARIRELGCQAGLSVRPKTPAEALLPYLDHLDLALVMTVEPGFGGQDFIPAMLEKVRFLAAERERRGLRFRIEVDGGVNAETGLQCREAGADTFVAGSAFFKAPDQAAFARGLAG